MENNSALTLDIQQHPIAFNEKGDCVHIFQLDNGNKNNRYTCVVCGEKMMACAVDKKDNGDSYTVAPYFRHESKSKCSESLPHFFCKLFLFTKGKKFEYCVNDEWFEFECDDFENEKHYKTPYGDYVPDVTLTDKDGNIIFVEINYTSKKTDDYCEKWEYLGNTVVEVDIRKMNEIYYEQSEPKLIAIFHNGIFTKHFHAKNKRNNFYNFEDGRKTFLQSINNTTRKLIKYENLYWFWEEIWYYLRGDKEESEVLDVFNALDILDMLYCTEYFYKEKCLPQDFRDRLKQSCEEKFLDYCKNFLDESSYGRFHIEACTNHKCITYLFLNDEYGNKLHFRSDYYEYPIWVDGKLKVSPYMCIKKCKGKYSPSLWKDIVQYLNSDDFKCWIDDYLVYYKRRLNEIEKERKLRQKKAEEYGDKMTENFELLKRSIVSYCNDTDMSDYIIGILNLRECRGIEFNFNRIKRSLIILKIILANLNIEQLKEKARLFFLDDKDCLYSIDKNYSSNINNDFSNVEKYFEIDDNEKMNLSKFQSLVDKKGTMLYHKARFSEFRKSVQNDVYKSQIMKNFLSQFNTLADKINYLKHRDAYGCGMADDIYNYNLPKLEAICNIFLHEEVGKLIDKKAINELKKYFPSKNISTVTCRSYHYGRDKYYGCVCIKLKAMDNYCNTCFSNLVNGVYVIGYYKDEIITVCKELQLQGFIVKGSVYKEDVSDGIYINRVVDFFNSFYKEDC